VRGFKLNAERELYGLAEVIRNGKKSELINKPPL
jgi:hypothetical protein